jgi:hypothetical protein
MKAHDFSYENLTEHKRKLMCNRYGSDYETEVEISAAKLPQKQHIVPYSLLKGIYSIAARGRLVDHEINNIGNLTFISEALNGIETGLGDRPIRWEVEDPENLKRHFLAGEVAGDLSAFFLAVIGSRGTGDSSAKNSYRQFCDARRRLIARGFAGWLREEMPPWRLDRRITPEKRLFYSFDDDLIRELQFPAELEDVILARIKDPQFRLTAKEDKASKEKEISINRRGNSKDIRLELKRHQGSIEIISKNSDVRRFISRLASAGSLETTAEGQWYLRVDPARPATAVSVLSTLLDEVLSAKPQSPSSPT